MKKKTFAGLLTKAVKVPTQKEIDTMLYQQELVRKMRPVNMFRKI